MTNITVYCGCGLRARMKKRTEDPERTVEQTDVLLLLCTVYT